MKYCPNCKADVEGLVNRCDLCGASLNKNAPFLVCICYELPECIGYSTFAIDMVKKIEPKELSQYNDFLEKVAIELFCYPESLLITERIRNRVYYSHKRKFARLTVLIDYVEFMQANQEIKAKLVYKAIDNGINLLQNRLLKDSYNIDEIVARSKRVLTQYGITINEGI